jgi:hypothetical protein
MTPRPLHLDAIQAVTLMSQTVFSLPCISRAIHSPRSKVPAVLPSRSIYIYWMLVVMSVSSPARNHQPCNCIIIGAAATTAGSRMKLELPSSCALNKAHATNLKSNKVEPSSTNWTALKSLGLLISGFPLPVLSIPVYYYR